MIYMDYAATTPMRDEVLKVYQDASKKFYGNPSSLHDIGTEAERGLTLCREQLAKSLRGNFSGIYFTSGGSESNVLAIRSLLAGNEHKGKHLITSQVEHASLHHLFEQLETEGYDVTFVGVDEYGRINVDELEQAVQDDTVLASMQYVNSETGVIQPTRKIGSILERSNVIFHTDAVQAFGKIPIDVTESKIDSVSMASHKIYGPKGIGACYINPSVRWKSQYPGATHEGGFRIGTVDVPSVIAFTTAVQMAQQKMEEEQLRLSQLRTRLLRRLTHLEKYFTVQGHHVEQLPNVVGLTCRNVQGQHIMLECNRYGIAISTGSACQVGQQHPSRIMLAIGKTTEEANSFIRLSFGLRTTDTDIDEVCNVLEKVITEI